MGLPLTPKDLLFGFIPLLLERLLCKFTSLIYVVYIFCYSATSSSYFFMFSVLFNIMIVMSVFDVRLGNGIDFDLREPGTTLGHLLKN